MRSPFASLGVIALGLLAASDAAGQHAGQHGGGQQAPPSAQHAPNKDARQRLVLPRAERERVLAEMRMMLESVSGMLQALGDNNLAAAERAARGSGTMHAIEADPKVRKLLPKQFLELGDQLHKRLDDLVDRLEAGATRDEAIKALGTLTGTSVACHATYRIDEKR